MFVACRWTLIVDKSTNGSMEGNFFGYPDINRKINSKYILLTYLICMYVQLDYIVMSCIHRYILLTDLYSHKDV